MKVENTGSSTLLYTGSIENSDRYAKSKEVERQQADSSIQTTTSAFMDTSIQGSVFDAKA